MPTYEYACRACGTHLEVVQKFTDDPLTDCPQCDGELRKVFQPIGIAFKGSGFYRNDSRGSSATPAADATGDRSSTAAASDSGSSSSSTTSGASSPTPPSSPSSSGSSAAAS